MESLQERAYAKLNLTLGVLSRRPDGYHSLDSLMQTVDLCDVVTIRRDAQVTVTASGEVLPYNNTLRRAALAYQAYTGRGANIHVVKRIPSEAGLGGGSADAAAVLRGLQQLYGALPDDEVRSIALMVGADVPFCIAGGLQRAEGIGEVLTPLPSCKMYFALAKPAHGVSTRQLFSSLTLPRPRPDTAAAIAAIARADLPSLGALLFNALEEPACALVPEIRSLRAQMMAAGALGAAMTGSGSAVFGLFSSAVAARNAVSVLEKTASFAKACQSV